MLRSTILTLCLFSLLVVTYGAPGAWAEEAREDCRVCGMWIEQYINTRHVLTTAKGEKVYFCSFTCAAKYLKQEGAEAGRLQAADYLTAELVDVKDAFYVVESDAPPVMSYRSIVAFASREAAEKFQNGHGGKIMRFDEVLATQEY